MAFGYRLEEEVSSSGGGGASSREERLRARRQHSLRRSVGIFLIPDIKSMCRLSSRYSGPSRSWLFEVSDNAAVTRTVTFNIYSKISTPLMSKSVCSLRFSLLVAFVIVLVSEN